MNRQGLACLAIVVTGCIGPAKNNGSIIVSTTMPSTQPSMGTEVKQTQGSVAVGTGIESKMISPQFNFQGSAWPLVVVILGIAVVAAAAYIIKGRKAVSANDAESVQQRLTVIK